MKMTNSNVSNSKPKMAYLVKYMPELFCTTRCVTALPMRFHNNYTTTSQIKPVFSISAHTSTHGIPKKADHQPSSIITPPSSHHNTHTRIVV
jgi:hypothetical protein